MAGKVVVFKSQEESENEMLREALQRTVGERIEYLFHLMRLGKLVPSLNGINSKDFDANVAGRVKDLYDAHYLKKIKALTKGK
jgi:hypothetical protein